jgi:hypothetical protein
MTKTACEIWIAINEDGDYAVHAAGPSEATEQLSEDAGGACVRVIKITAKIAPPVVTETVMPYEATGASRQRSSRLHGTRLSPRR